MVRVEKIEFSPELVQYQVEWDALLEQSSRPTIFSTFDYVYTSCLHFKEDEEIFFLFMRDERTLELRAIFPLSLDRERVYGIEMKVLAHGITTYCTDVDKPYPVIRDGYEAECWKTFSAWLGKREIRWDVLDFDEFWPGSFLTTQLGTLFPFPKYWTKVSDGPESPIVKLDGDWDAFWMSHKKLRKHTRKLEKQLGENLVYKIMSNPADVEHCLNAYIATELISWKAGQFVSHPQKQRFYHDLFPRLAAAGRLHFGMLYDRDKVVSVEVAYSFGNRVYFAHGTYDPEYSALSPGQINSAWLIQSFHGKHYTVGDYLAGFSSYNNHWAHRIEKSVDIVVRRMGWKNDYLAVRHLARQIKRRLMRGKKQSSNQGTEFSTE